MIKNTLQSVLCTLAMGAVAAAGWAADREMALGADGEVYRVRTGAYGELFAGTPGFAPANAANPVLALEIAKPGTAPVRHLVPLSAGSETELSPSLIYEEASNTVFLVWESRHAYRSVVKLAGFDGTHWVEPPAPEPATSNSLSPKTPPQLAVTRDVYVDPVADDGPVLRHRTVVHLLWGEETDTTLQTFYVPMVFEDGVYSGAIPILLNEFDSDGPPATAFEVPANLLAAPTLAAGRDGRTVVAAFVSPASRRLITLEIDVLPRELVNLAGGARSQIIDIGAKLSYPANLRQLADRMRLQLVQGASAFQPEVATTLADQLHAYILTNGRNQGLENLAGGARSQIIDIGAKLSGRGLRPIDRLTRNAEIPVSSAGAAVVTGDATSDHVIQIRVVSDRPAPRVGTGPISLFVSRSGQEVLIAWPDQGKLTYRESRDNGWLDPRSLTVSESLGLPQAYRMLEQRIADR